MGLTFQLAFGITGAKAASFSEVKFVKNILWKLINVPNDPNVTL